MSRRKAATKRVILPDPLFENELIAKFVNVMMRRGKKSVAEKIVYGSLDKVLERSRVKSKAKPEAKGEKEDEEGSGGRGEAGGSIKLSASARKAALEIFEKVLDVVRPTVEVKSRRVGGATYQVPVEVKPEHGIALAMRWLVESAKTRGEKSMSLRLASEIMEALEGKGGAIKKREETHKMAKANQAFAHYRW
jgi:small subunit ribosomal protein S7